MIKTRWTSNVIAVNRKVFEQQVGAVLTELVLRTVSVELVIGNFFDKFCLRSHAIGVSETSDPLQEMWAMPMIAQPESLFDMREIL